MEDSPGGLFTDFHQPANSASCAGESFWGEWQTHMKPSGLVNLFLVPVLVGIISSATVWWFLQRERSELHLTLLSRSAIVDAERAALPPELKITYKDQPVKKLELLSFALTNSGTRTILPEQFKADISIVIPGRVIAAYSVAGLPRPLIAPISHTDQTVSVGPMLLNREDRALFNAITVDACRRCS